MFLVDAHLNILGFDGDPDSALFGVFDGHGGREVAVYCSMVYPGKLAEALKGVNFDDEEAVKAALVNSFIALDDSLLTEEAKKTLARSKGNGDSNGFAGGCYRDDDDDDDDDSNSSRADSAYVGCTAVVAFVKRGKLYVANAGDSRCIVSRSCGVLQEMSEDHKPHHPAERERIEKAGHTVSLEGRVDGNINISRTIGDHEYKSTALPHAERAVSCVPDVKVLDITAADVDYAVLACDGVWDVMGNQNLLNFIRKRLFPKSVADASDDSGVFSLGEAYVKSAFDKWPGDSAGTLGSLLGLVSNQVVQRCIRAKGVGDGMDNVSFMMVLFKGSSFGKLLLPGISAGLTEKRKALIEKKWCELSKTLGCDNNDKKRPGPQCSCDDDDPKYAETASVRKKRKTEWKKRLVFKEKKISP